MKIMNRTLATIAAFALLLAGSASAQNLVSDPGFESAASGANYAAGSTSIPGWTVDTTPDNGVYVAPPGQIGNTGSKNMQMTTSYTASGGIHQGQGSRTRRFMR